jgi:FMN reductase
MTGRTLAVVSAGLRQPSSTRLLADRLTAAAVDELSSRGFTVTTSVVELRDHAHDITNHMLTGFPSASLQSVLSSIVGADGLIAVSPIFTASVSGLFKSFADVLEDGSLAGKPVLIAATGGTARHSLALDHAMRPLMAYMRAVVMPTGVYAAPEDWSRSAPESSSAALNRRIHQAAAELAEEMARRESKPPVDPFELSTTFEDLLRGDSL